MQLTRYSDYALRVLMLLATSSVERVRIEDISRVLDVSENHLRKVANRLTTAGFVSGRRGRQGGLVLARPPEEINLGSLIRLLENTLTPVDCSTPPCRLFAGCRLRSVLGEAMQAFLQVLDGYTLADLVDDAAAQRTLRAVAAEFA